MPQKPAHAKLTQGPVGKVIFRMTLPMMIAFGGMLIFNLTDTFFVGRLGRDQLAALTFTFPVVMFIASIALGVGTGAAAVISRAIGEGNQQEVKRLTTDSLILALFLCSFAVTIGFFTIEPLFKLLGASDEILIYIKQYMRIWYPGVLFVMIPMVGNNAIRATGDTRTPSIIMLIAACVNLVLDPLLIFGIGPFPRLGITGAAIATLIARAVTMFAAIYILAYREKMLIFEKPEWKPLFFSFKQILSIGIPAAFSRILLPVGSGVITKLISTYGVAAIAAFGIGIKIEFFALAPAVALSSVIGPFVGQNSGAGEYDRVNKGIRGSIRFAFIYGLIAWGFLSVLAPYIISFINNDTEVIRIGTLFLKITPAGFVFAGILLITTMSLNVLKKPIQSSGINLIQMFILYIPLAYLFSYQFGLKGIFAASVVSYLLAGIFALFVVLKIIKK